MFFGKKRRRQKLLDSPLAADTWTGLVTRVPLLATLPPGLARRLQGVTQVLLAEKNFEACGGLELTPEMPLVICAQASLLQLHPQADFFPALDSVLVYPEAFLVEHPIQDEFGIVNEETAELAGESWHQGAVILSWQDIEDELAEPDGSYNVVLHEFAHQLDEETGIADGQPLLANQALAARWAEVFGRAFSLHKSKLLQNKEILFDENAAESPAEFLATAFELFFTVPAELLQEYSEVYSVMAEHLTLDPASW